MTATPDPVQQAIQAARAGRRLEAREMLLEVVEAEPRNETAWIWLTGLVDLLEDKIIACENVLTINPSNERVRSYLYQLLREQKEAAPQPQPVQEAEEPIHRRVPSQPTRVETSPSMPMQSASISLWDLARQYEAEGNLEGALEAYSEQAARTRDAREFDRIYREITRLEALQQERIQHIAPSSTILRMSFGWPLLYLFLSLVQMGLNPVVHPSWYLWLGLPIVMVGGFLLALSEVRSRHRLWHTLFAEESEAGTGTARLVAKLGGWALIILPHLLLLVDSLNRLTNFDIPYPPF